MENPIEQRKRMVQDRIEKSFGDGLNVSEEIEKASHGVYEDNAENRRKNRVGQEYGHAAQQKEPTGKTAGAAKTVDEHAAEASDKALERAAADKNAPEEVRNAAQKELDKRNNDNNDKEPSNEEKPEDKKPAENKPTERKPEHAEEKTDKKSQEAKISETLTKMKFNGNQVHWPADLDISEVQKKYGFDLDDCYFDEEKNQFTGYAVKYEKDSSGRPVSKPFDAEQELGDIQAKAVRKARKVEKKPAATDKKSKSSGGGDDGGKKDETSDIINDQGYENEDNTIVKRRNELRSKLKNGGKWDGLNEEENKEYEELGKTIRNARIQWGNNQEKKEKQRLREETENQGKGKIDFGKLGNRGNIATFKFERGYKDDGEDHILRIMNTYGKKDIKQDLDTLNEKLGTDLKLEDFKKRSGEWYGNRFEVFFNTETGEVDANIRKEWKNDKPFKEYNKYSAEELLGGYYTYLNGEGKYDHKKIKSELKDIVEKHGALKVAKSFVKNAVGAETLDGNSVQNKDEAKCEISNIFKEWGIKTDEETKKFLEYNPDNVWWL